MTHPCQWDYDAAVESLMRLPPKSSIFHEFLAQIAMDPTSGPVYRLTAQGRGALDELQTAFFAKLSMTDEMRSFIEGMSVSVDVSTGDDDAGNRYFGTVTEVMDDNADKHGVTLLVQNAEPNFAALASRPEAPPASASPATVAQPAAKYSDSTPRLHVGDSAFEDWYQNYLPNSVGHKQIARDAYAAGMGDPLVMARTAQPCPSQGCGGAGSEAARTHKDCAIEHAEYMATTAEGLIEAVNDLAKAEQEQDDGLANPSDVNAAQETVCEFLGTLRNRIYEFRKRKDRAALKGATPGGEGASE
ncbi:hypothetical protein J2W35_003231 [Variovorax boronicumulans]|uniref:hypothetical protein n=1 Tax=Variovorax boronicumulans TaxID=436515 RepID=UPI00277DEB8F|nr:hypothetical protein [Variovorax boronicumulans]MDQ0082872.1 hypothetical protein [Variovorax boronicumulans]